MDIKKGKYFNESKYVNVGKQYIIDTDDIKYRKYITDSS